MSFGLYHCGGQGGFAMASQGPRSNLLWKTQVGSASEAAFVASSNLCVAPEVCYQIPGLTTVKPVGVSLCNAATTSSVLIAVGVHRLKPRCFVCKRNKSPPSRLFSPSGIKEDTTIWRGFDANIRSLSVTVNQGDAKQSWQRHFSRASSPPHAKA